MATPTWKPLNASKDEIRLLVLYPNECLRAHPQGRLEIVTLFEQPHFEAISWAWSRSEWSHPMVIGKDELLVPRSLYRCLQRLRFTRLERRLWVDVLCIAQHDEKERAQQVQIMHRIFNYAMEVHAWLGEGCKDSDRGMQILARTYPGPNDRVPEDPNHKDFHAMAALGTARYWQRLWPISEQVLAGNLTLHYAGFTLTRDELAAARRRLRGVHEYLVQVSPGSLLLRNIEQIYVSVSRLIRRLKLLETFQHRSTLRKAMALLTIFSSGRGQEVSDDKDRVYGLLGVCTALLGEPIAVDYTTCTRAVYLDFARHFLERTNSLIILNQATPHKNALSGLPSWVPDWSSHYTHQEEIRVIDLWGVFKACGSIPVPWSPMKINEGSLTLAVIRLDTVNNIGVPYRWAPPDSQNIVQTWHETYLQHGGNNESAFARTLCRGVSRLVHSEEVLADVQRLEPGEAEDRLETAFRCWDNRDGASETKAKGLEVMNEMIYDARFFVTQRGRPGLGPTSTRPGDEVMIALGANLPLLLRPTDHEGSRQWSFVGELYVDGLMYGEAVEGLSEHDFEQITIE